MTGPLVLPSQPTNRYPRGPVGWWQRRQDQQADLRQAEWLTRRWGDVVMTLGLSQQRPGTLGAVIRWPEVDAVQPGQCPALTVVLVPGTLPEDLAAETQRIAHGMGYGWAAVRPLTRGRAVVQLLASDPLTEWVRQVPDPIRTHDVPLLLGYGQTGPVRATLRQLRHIVVQGQTGAGKSRWLYGLLAQVAGAPDVLVAGSDVAGMLLRPWADTEHGAWQAIAGHTAGHLAVLQRLENELDDRLASMPTDLDEIGPDESRPVLLTVIDEYAGLIRKAAQHAKGSAEEIKRITGRLLGEGRKVAMYGVLSVHRADTTFLTGFDRGQAVTRLSFRVDSADAVTMLHPGQAGKAAAEVHATAPDGVALLSGTDQPLTRIRAPYMPSYSEYSALIRQRTACLPD